MIFAKILNNNTAKLIVLIIKMIVIIVTIIKLIELEIVTKTLKTNCDMLLYM